MCAKLIGIGWLFVRACVVGSSWEFPAVESDRQLKLSRVQFGCEIRPVPRISSSTDTDTSQRPHRKVNRRLSSYSNLFPLSCLPSSIFGILPNHRPLGSDSDSRQLHRKRSVTRKRTSSITSMSNNAASTKAPPAAAQVDDADDLDDLDGKFVLALAYSHRPNRGVTDL